MYAPLVISGILEEVLVDKVAITNTNILGDALNEHLSLSDYGDGIAGIAFIYVVTPP